jgi:hypothetical protein
LISSVVADRASTYTLFMGDPLHGSLLDAQVTIGRPTNEKRENETPLGSDKDNPRQVFPESRDGERRG